MSDLINTLENKISHLVDMDKNADNGVMTQIRAEQVDLYEKVIKALSASQAREAELREREMVLVEACKSAHDVFITQVGADYNDKIHAVYLKCCAAIDQSKTADKVLRWHLEWMRTLPVQCEKSINGLEWNNALTVDLMPCGTKLVAIPPLPKESKE